MHAEPLPRQPLAGNRDWKANWTLHADTTHAEIMEVATGLVWLAQEPMTRARFDALLLPERFVKTGIGESVADEAYFRRSPDAPTDGPVETLWIDGFEFSLVARPDMPERTFPGGLILPVHKHHVVRYAAGRSIQIMDCGDGHDYVQLTANAQMMARPPRPVGEPVPPRRMPGDWSVREVSLAHDLVVELPCPTRVVFFTNGDSFQGPLALGL